MKKLTKKVQIGHLYKHNSNDR